MARTVGASDRTASCETTTIQFGNCSNGLKIKLNDQANVELCAELNGDRGSSDAGLFLKMKDGTYPLEGIRPFREIHRKVEQGLGPLNAITGHQTATQR
jgi:hypothetical protein